MLSPFSAKNENELVHSKDIQLWCVAIFSFIKLTSDSNVPRNSSSSGEAKTGEHSSTPNDL